MTHFWAVHDFIYHGLLDNPPVSYTVKDIAAFARTTLNLDGAQFERDVDSDETYSFLDWDRTQAINMGIRSTPSVFICGELIERDNLERIIDDYLKN